MNNKEINEFYNFLHSFLFHQFLLFNYEFLTVLYHVTIFNEGIIGGSIVNQGDSFYY